MQELFPTFLCRLNQAPPSTASNAKTHANCSANARAHIAASAIRRATPHRSQQQRHRQERLRTQRIVYARHQQAQRQPARSRCGAALLRSPTPGSNYFSTS